MDSQITGHMGRINQPTRSMRYMCISVMCVVMLLSTNDHMFVCTAFTTNPYSNKINIKSKSTPAVLSTLHPKVLPFAISTQKAMMKSMALQMAKDNKKGENDDEKKDKKSLIPQPIQDFIASMKTKLDNILPSFVWEWLSFVVQKLPTLKVAFFSFISGLVIALCAILIPVYSQLDELEEPVTLFETILNDLNIAYVDQVDTQKLFETGISAMLSSLDPYTEFEGRTEAVEMNESVKGKYAGVGLVISGNTIKPSDIEKIASEKENGGVVGDEDLDDVADSSTSKNKELDDDELFKQKNKEKLKDRGIRVVSAFEGYAFDYGMRVGDKLLAVDGTPITEDMTVENVRNLLRGEPGTSVSIAFERVGVEGEQIAEIPRQIVTMNTVKLASIIGKQEDGIGYIQLSSFAEDTGNEMRRAILSLQQRALIQSQGQYGLKGLIVDLRGNPGGLLTSAVDVASLFVPQNSDIVSARGRGFPSVLYRSRVQPLVPPDTKVAVLVNGGTASAAEIVSGAIQDLDVGVVVGSDRTFGKGLVQNVEELPFDTALKFTVAKYYTPSGRCIQALDYKEGGGNIKNGDKSSLYQATRVKEENKQIFYTKSGRVVKDGGGIEADYKVPAPQASALEVTLLRTGVFDDYAADWSSKYKFSDNFEVNEDLYKDFQKFVNTKQRSNDIRLEALYSKPLADLKKSLKQSGYKLSEQELKKLQASIVSEVQRDFDKYKKDIKEDLENAILARYLPESMLIQRSVKSDTQVDAAYKLLSTPNGKFDQLLARDTKKDYNRSSPTSIANNRLSSSTSSDDKDSLRFQSFKW